MNRTHLLPGLTVTDHVFTLPLDHADPAGRSIEVFARELVDPGRAGEKLPWLLYLQGGPGGKSPRPLNNSSGWLARALTTHRVLLLDQRGTGRSTPVTARSAQRFASARALADHLSHFRADSIVADAELIRHRLCGDEPWETLGQSYGGFITLTYLSQAPHGLRACYVTGGLPGLDTPAEAVYTATYPRVRDKVTAYYTRYPDDRELVRRIADMLERRTVRLPDGDQLTVRRLRSLGLMLGMGDGSERLHWLLDEALDGGEFSATFLHQVLNLTSFADNPLFAVLHESAYCQGGKAAEWAAARAMAAHPEFDEQADPLLFTGEMIYPWMFTEIAGLRPFAQATDLLAERVDWPALYDAPKLAANRVPVAAVIYHDDMYVHAGFSLTTARSVGGLRAWVTNEWEHDGVSAAGGHVLGRLMDMAGRRV